MNLPLGSFYNRILIIIILSVGLASRPCKSETIILTDTTEDISLQGGLMGFFIDSTGTLSFEELLKINPKFQPKPESLHQDNADLAYWFKLQINDQTTHDRKWVFENYSIYTDNLEFYAPAKEGGYSKKTYGSSRPFHERPYQHINYVLDLPSKKGKYNIYIRVKSSSGSGFAYFIRTQEFFTNRALNEYLFLGIYYGILLLTAVYNLLLYFGSKENVNLYYSIYVFFCMLLSLEGDGLGFQHVWPNYPEINHTVIHLSYPFFLGSFFVYSTSFLELRFRLKKVFLVLAIFTAVYIFLESFDLLNSWFSNNLYLAPFIGMYAAAIYLFAVKKFKAARFFILGFSVVLLSIIITRLVWAGRLEPTLFTVYSFNFGIVLEVVVLSFAIGDKVKLIKLEKDTAQQNVILALEENKALQTKVNKELESKVRERTAELELQKQELQEAKKSLEDMTEELNEMNAKLDYDNWQLNRKVSEQTEARLSSKKLSFEEFMALFPDEESSLKLLESLKWPEDFTCIKCGNTKYTKKDRLARRCSKCSYLESVTKNTLFQAIKFPINKAFYITYLVATESDDLTVDQLAQLLDLRRNTCWSFRKRAAEKRDQLLLNSGKSRVKSWQDLILNN